MQHHGSEVRLLSKARSFNNPFVEVKKFWKNEKLITSRLKKWGKVFDHAIIADYELYSYIEPYYKNIHIIRQPINVMQYTPSYPIPNNNIPRIVHAPFDKK